MTFKDWTKKKYEGEFDPAAGWKPSERYIGKCNPPKKKRKRAKRAAKD